MEEGVRPWETIRNPGVRTPIADKTVRFCRNMVLLPSGVAIRAADRAEYPRICTEYVECGRITQVLLKFTPPLIINVA